MAERNVKVIEETGPYYPGMVVASKEQAESQRGGISSFDNKLGRVEGDGFVHVDGEHDEAFFADLKLKLNGQ